MGARASSEKNNKNLLAQLNELNKKIEEANMTLGDFEGAKRKVAAENGDLLRGAGDVNNNMAMIQKANQALVGNLDEAKRVADDEARERHLLLGKYRNIEHELDGVKDNLEEEIASREDVCRQVNKAESESNMWRQRYETEAESTIENLNGKLGQIERARARIQADIDEMNVNLDQAQILNNTMEKKARHFDKIVGEWKRKVDGLN